MSYLTACMFYLATKEKVYDQNTGKIAVAANALIKQVLLVIAAVANFLAGKANVGCCY